jgi:hypothetical protein
MSLFVARLFLVLLLGVDWYTEPPAGLSPTGRSLASTDAVCRSDVTGTVPGLQAAAQFLSAKPPCGPDLASAFGFIPPGYPPAAFRGAPGLIYVTMSLRR